MSAPAAARPTFEVRARLDSPGGLGRTGVLHTPHGDVRTPAFVPVGTKADVKALIPEQVAALGAQAVLANAYHLYLEPGADVVAEAGGLGRFMGWPGPTFTDSGGFQVLSLGSGYRKVLSEEFAGDPGDVPDPRAERALVRRSRAQVGEDGVVFRSHIDGSAHRFTPEVSIGIQHALGADVLFAFDELTSLRHPYAYQVESLARTARWARRCLAEHRRLSLAAPERPRQQLWGVVQGAQWPDLRRRGARAIATMEVGDWRFDGFGIGGALEKRRLGEIVSWVSGELPEDRPRHLLGIAEPEDLFAAVEAGADTFDCVSPARVARNAAVYTPTGRVNVTGARYKRDFRPLVPGCGCYTCAHFSRAYVRHLFKAHEILAATLATIHNEWTIVHLVDGIRTAIEDGRYADYKADVLGRLLSGGSRRTL